MKRIRRRIMTAALAIVMLAMCFQNVLATDTGMLPTGIASSNPYSTDGFTYELITRATGLIDTENSTLSLSSPTAETLRVYICIKGTDTMTQIGFSSLKVQKWTGSTWSDDLDLGSKYSNNTNSCVYNKTLYDAVSDSYYRLECKAYAKNSSGQTQTVTFTTEYITCK